MFILQPGTLALLLAIGYQQNQEQQYVWQSTSDQKIRENRENVAKEFSRFYSMLKESKRNPRQLKDFLLDCLTLNERQEENSWRIQLPTRDRPSSSPIIQNRSLPYLLPSSDQVNERNAKTIERINSLKVINK